MPSVTTTAGGCAIAIIMGLVNRQRPTRTELFFSVFFRWRTYREREFGAVPVDVQYVFAPLFTQPLVAFYPIEEGTASAPPMFDDGQFRQDQQAVVGHFFLPYQVQHGNQDPPAPGTHRITGHDLLRVDEGDAASTNSHQDSSIIRFLENLVN